MSLPLYQFTDLSSIQHDYSKQIGAFNSLYKETNMKMLFPNTVKFGGGTALSIYHFQHRLSFDIDLFVSDCQYLDYFRPHTWVEESEDFKPEGINAHNHVGLITKSSIKVDILIDTNSTCSFIDKTHSLFPFDVYIESIEDIIAKKITFRKKDNKTRDIFDIAVALTHNENLFNELILKEKIECVDLLTLKNALENLDKNKYFTQLYIVEPKEKYKQISQDAPNIIINHIEKIVRESLNDENQKSLEEDISIDEAKKLVGEHNLVISDSLSILSKS